MEFGWWQTSAKQRPELRLKTIFDGVIDLIEQFNPHAVAVEESFVGVDARTALSVGQARGAVLVAAASLGFLAMLPISVAELGTSMQTYQRLMIFKSWI